MNNKRIIEDIDAHIGRDVHVEGWNEACWFELYEHLGNGVCILKTSRGKKYRTKNRLYHLKRDEKYCRVCGEWSR